MTSLTMFNLVKNSEYLYQTKSDSVLTSKTFQDLHQNPGVSRLVKPVSEIQGLSRSWTNPVCIRLDSRKDYNDHTMGQKLTLSSSSFVLSSRARISFMVRPYQSSVQQKTCRWKLLKIRCSVWNKKYINLKNKPYTGKLFIS